MTRVIFRQGRFGASIIGAIAAVGPFAATVITSTFVPVSDAAAQTVETPKPQKPQKKSGEAAAAKAPDRSAAEQAYASGVRAFDAGKLPEAVTALSNALMSGGLPNPQMARALFLRGQAYRKQGQAALAYTDLTSALWLKNGLSEPDKSKAVAEREAAHREAGLGTQVPPVPGTDAKSKVAQPAQPAATAPKPGVDVASAPTNSSFLSSLNPLNLIPGSSSTPTAQAQPQPAAPAPVAAAPVAVPTSPVASEPAVSSWSTTSAPAQQAAAAPAAGYVEAAPQAQQSEAASNPVSSATDAVTGFFGSMFGSSSGATATSQPSSPVTTASTGAPAPLATPEPPSAASAPAAAAAPGAAPIVPWSNPDAALPATTAAGPSPPAQKKAPAKIAAVAGPQAQAIKPSTQGKYRLQVATVNTREEADKIAATVAQNPLLAGSQPEVDSVVYGNMGTFFRVRTGPYAKSTEPQELCKQLRPQGYDCLVVTQ